MYKVVWRITHQRYRVFMQLTSMGSIHAIMPLTSRVEIANAFSSRPKTMMSSMIVALSSSVTE